MQRRYGSYGRRLLHGGAVVPAAAPPPPAGVAPSDIPDCLCWRDSDTSRVTQVAGVVSNVAWRYEGVAMGDMAGPAGSEPVWSATTGSASVPGIRFNVAATTRLQSVDAVVANALDASAALTYVCVAEVFSYVAASSMWGINATASALNYAEHRTSGASQLLVHSRRDAGGVMNTTSTPLVAPLNALFFFASRWASGTYKFNIDGSLQTYSLGVKTLTTCNQFTIGNISTGGGAAFATAFQGASYHEAWFTRSITDLEVADMRTYFRSIYPSLP